MARVTYLGDPRGQDEKFKAADPGRLSLFGYAFTLGTPVEVDDEKALAKFRGNPHFEVAKAPRASKKVSSGNGLDSDKA